MQPEALMDRKKAGVADYLANERTFLAWIRTSIALVGLGFVIVKFALFLRQMAFVLGDKHPIPPGKGVSGIIGVVMVALGAVVALFAFVRYLQVVKQLDENKFYPGKWLLALLAFIMVAISTGLAIYLVPGIKD